MTWEGRRPREEWKLASGELFELDVRSLRSLNAAQGRVRKQGAGNQSGGL